MGLKLIIFLGLAWAIYALVRRTRGRRPPPPASHSDAPVDTVRCRHCGTHLPKPEALRQDDDWYCCPEHRDRDRDPTQR